MPLSRTRVYKIDFKCDRLADQSLRLQAKVPNEVEKYGLCYGTSTHPKVTDDFLEEQERSVTSWTIKDLKPGTTYYIRAYHKEGTKITYFEDSEINVRTLGSGGTDIELSFTGDEGDYDAYYNVTYTITYSNLPNGMNEFLMYIRDYNYSRNEVIKEYSEESSGTLKINPTEIDELWGVWMDLVVCVKNYETGIWYFKAWKYSRSHNPSFYEVHDEDYYFDYWMFE